MYQNSIKPTIKTLGSKKRSPNETPKKPSDTGRRCQQMLLMNPFWPTEIKIIKPYHRVVLSSSINLNLGNIAIEGVCICVYILSLFNYKGESNRTFLNKQISPFLRPNMPIQTLNWVPRKTA